MVVTCRFPIQQLGDGPISRSLSKAKVVSSIRDWCHHDSIMSNCTEVKFEKLISFVKHESVRGIMIIDNGKCQRWWWSTWDNWTSLSSWDPPRPTISLAILVAILVLEGVFHVRTQHIPLAPVWWRRDHVHLGQMPADRSQVSEETLVSPETVRWSECTRNPASNLHRTISFLTYCCWLSPKHIHEWSAYPYDQPALLAVVWAADFGSHWSADGLCSAHCGVSRAQTKS